MGPEEKAALYNYSVAWSEEDQAFIGRVAEWSLLAADGETAPEAMQAIQELVAWAIEDCENEGDAYPEPYSARKYSGRFQVRLPSDLHRELVMQAEAQGVSLNQLVAWMLAQGSTSKKLAG